jgi:hypothetical protein
MFMIRSIMHVQRAARHKAWKPVIEADHIQHCGNGLPPAPVCEKKAPATS